MIHKISPSTTRPNSHSQSYFVKKGGFIPPPIGLRIVSQPPRQIFDMFLNGDIGVDKVLSQTARKSTVDIPEQPQPSSTRRKGLNLFSLVNQAQKVKASDNQKQRSSILILKKRHTLNKLTISSREMYDLQIQNGEKRDRTATQVSPAQVSGKYNSMVNIKSTLSPPEEVFIKQQERIAGEKFTDEEIRLLMKKNITDKDMWIIMNKFQKKKWFFEYIHRHLNEPQAQPKQSLGLLQKVRNIIQLQKPKKTESQVQEYFTHIKNIEESLKQFIFNRETPRRLQKSNANIKEYRSESAVQKLRLRKKFYEATSNFDPQTPNPELLDDVFEFQDEKIIGNYQNIRKYEHHKKQEDISRETLSCASQNDTFKSVTEFQLNELYHESKQRQKQYQKDFQGQYLDNADQLQKKVKQIVKIRNIQSTILNVVQQKLKL